MKILSWILGFFKKEKNPKDVIIAQLKSDLSELKLEKQKQLDRTNSYWKAKLATQKKPILQ